MIPLPYGLDFFTWSALVAEQYPSIDMYDGRGEVNAWKEWGERVRLIDDFVLVPSPKEFSTWEDWAERVVEVLQ